MRGGEAFLPFEANVSKRLQRLQQKDKGPQLSHWDRHIQVGDTRKFLRMSSLVPMSPIKDTAISTSYSHSNLGPLKKN